MQNKKFHPLVSIIIPVFNGENYIKKAIDSALDQTYDNIEIIVVNDGSTDKTEQIVKSYGNRVKYFRKENHGVASAINYGIKQMNGEYFSWLSHDDKYINNKVEKQVNRLIQLKNKKTILFSNFELIDNKDCFISRTFFEKKSKLELINKGIYPVLSGMVNGNSILIHRDIFDDVGLFNESVKTSSDYEMWFKIFKKYEHVFMEDALVCYRIHKDQDTNKNAVYNKESDDLWVFIISNITEEDFKLFNVSRFQIYINLYNQMKNANLKNAMDLAYQLAKDNYDKPQISVLMPVYNCEKYVARSIESILNQSFGDFELIIINDCTPDDSMSIAKKYAEKDFRIKVIENQENLGVGKTIDVGIKNANGKYFTRMDGDDTSDSDRLLLQYLELEKNNFDYCATNINIIDRHDNVKSYTVYDEIKYPIEFALAFTNPIPNSTIMYSLDIVRKNDLLFGNYRVAEDYSFLIKYSKYGKGIMLSNTLYNYRILTDSLFHKLKDEALEISLNLSMTYYKDVFKRDIDETYKLLNTFFEQKEGYKKSISKNKLYDIINEFNDIVTSFIKNNKYNEEIQKNCVIFLTDRVFYLYDQYLEKNNNKSNKKSLISIIKEKIAWYYLHNGFWKTIKWILSKPFNNLRRNK